ncbi:coiled-coil domain-containing protein [Methanoplanus limicola]|uniref:Uncharacterized protein n=1 Tax=Methanoplanus limicola DSM 2279 TaxID=937775 RepID=H1Z388_9EURY|nr:hypothetical protein [Methanoplanus limicola]EHQ36503.1 hypothetical protein Metlim_2455 [Methanoplanus limicola DSM 2279]
MNNENYSLCLTIIEQNNYSQLLRLADPIGKDGQTLWKLDGKSHKLDLPNIKTISMDRYQAKNNDLAIWKWELNPEDQKKQLSNRTNEKFYELIFLDDENIDSKDEIKTRKLEDLIDILISGFKIPEFITDNLLLVFDKSKRDGYICFDLKKSDYSIENNTMKIKEGTTLEIHKIREELCIDTDNYIKNATIKNYYAQRRIIYRERKLKKPDGQLKIKSFISLFKSYFEEITEKMNYDDEQRNIIKKTISNALDNREDIEAFFKLTGSDNEEFIFTHNTTSKFEETAQIIKKYASDKGMKNFLESVIENTPEFKEYYLDILKEDYLTDEKEKAEQELKILEEKKTDLQNIFNKKEKDLNNELKSLELKKAEITNEYRKKEEKITEYNNKISNLENRNEQLNKYCEEKVESIKENTGALLGEIAVLKGITQNSATPIQDYNLTKNCSKSFEGDNIYSITNKEDLIGGLEKNLDSILIPDEYNSGELARFIIGSYLSKTPVLLIGNTSQLLAETISITFCGRTSEIIFVPTGFRNYDELLNSVRSSESNVVFIKNAVGFCDEYIYLNLIKDNPDKFLLFSAEFQDTIRILPAGILGYMSLIDCEKIILPFNLNEIYDDLTPAKIEEMSNAEYNKNQYMKLYKEICELSEESGLKNGYNLLRAKILSTLLGPEKEENKSLINILLPELVTYNQIQENTDNYLDYLQTLDKTEYYKIAEKLSGGER